MLLAIYHNNITTAQKWLAEF